MEYRRVWECACTFWGPCWSKEEHNSKTLHVASQEKALIFQMMRSWLKVAYRQWSRKPGEQVSEFVAFRDIPGIWGCRSISPQVSWFYFLVVWLWSQAQFSGQHYRCWQLLGLPGPSLTSRSREMTFYLPTTEWKSWSSFSCDNISPVPTGECPVLVGGHLGECIPLAWVPCVPGARAHRIEVKQFSLQLLYFVSSWALSSISGSINIYQKRVNCAR